MQSEATSELVSGVADEIMTYLNENTSAGDTPRGIWQWWLTDLRDKVDVAIVEQALERLVAQGHMGMWVLASGATLYFGLGASKRGET